MTDFDYIIPANEKLIEKEQREELDYHWLLSDERGRRLLWDILSKCGVFRSSFSTEELEMAFNEGKRSIGNVLFRNAMEYGYENFILMLREGKIDDK